MKGIPNDLTGRRFGRLVVLRKEDSIKASGKSRTTWLCKCDCGKQKIVRSEYLMRGSCASCGCGEHIRELKLTGLERLYNLKRYEASRRNGGLEFTLTPEEFNTLVAGDCYYCGVPPSLKHHMVRKNDKVAITYNGIDRMVNTIGYQYSNCVPCCWKCNAMKLNFSYDDFLKTIARIYERHCMVTEDTAE